ncbi:hypothetical protein [Streptomyces sp. NPDC057696]|uniref:hypothetical protein n=1 Tax=Streptomyces sp. NPDC057696 TaxID=3346218 RepID=UPI0036870BA2
MHVMLRRAAVTAGALSALLGFGVFPANAAQPTPAAPAAQPAFGVSPAQAAQAAPAAKEWECYQLLARRDGKYQCPALPSYAYTFTNNSEPVSDGPSMYVYLCPTPANGGCDATPESYFYLKGGESQTWTLNEGWAVYLYAPYTIRVELTLDATPWPPNSAPGSARGARPKVAA